MVLASPYNGGEVVVFREVQGFAREFRGDHCRVGGQDNMKEYKRVWGKFLVM